jgi:4-hydroxybenzoate polyprenyltransferase
MRMQFVLDLKDIESDRREGLLTLGVIYGKEKILKILKISSFITVALVPLLIFLFLDFTPVILILSFLIIFDFYIIYLIKKGNFKAYILESGEFILWPILIAIGSKL